MASASQICSLAMQRLGETQQVNLTSPGNKASRECALLYEPARDAVLRDHPWNFAMERDSLAALAAAPEWGYANQFQLPPDYIRMVEEQDDDDSPWHVEGGKVLTDDAAPLKIRYIKRVTDSALFDPIFIMALSAYMAWILAEPMTQSNTKEDRMWKAYKGELARAKAADGQEQTPDEIAEDRYITVRA